MVPTQITSQDEFLAFFDSLLGQSSSLLISKAYRGITLTRKIKTMMVNQQGVVFKAFDRDICTAIKGRVYLHSQLLIKPVMARVKDQPISKGLFSLFDFSHIQGEWKDRNYERVQPKDPTYISLNHRNMAVRASLLDISLNGMGVLVGSSDDHKLDFQPNNGIRSDFQTSPNFGWTKLGGAIHYQQKVAKSIVRLGIRLYPKVEQHRQLKEYIDNRKAEILDELDQEYLPASFPAGIEHHYF
jgi:hypothetical protein